MSQSDYDYEDESSQGYSRADSACSGEGEMGEGEGEGEEEVGPRDIVLPNEERSVSKVVVEVGLKELEAGALAEAYDVVCIVHDTDGKSLTYVDGVNTVFEVSLASCAVCLPQSNPALTRSFVGGNYRPSALLRTTGRGA